MKRWHAQKHQICKLIAGGIGGVLCYLAVVKTIPFVSPVLAQTALFSASVSFGFDTEAVFAGSGDADPLDEQVQTSGDSVETTPEESTDLTEESSSEQTETTSLDDQTLQKPENAGTIVRQQYKGGGSGTYIPLAHGYIKNSTKVSTETIQQTIAQKPAFSIIADGKTPEVLIMHSHATESYQPGIYDWFDPSFPSRNRDTSKNMCRVGAEIKAQLVAAGIGVIQDETLHDYPSYTGSYERSAQTVKSYLEKYPTIKVVLDVHRDAIQPANDRMIAPATTINGKPCAQVMIISGADDGTMNMPNYLENLKLSAALQNQMEADYPTLTRPVMFSYRKYNQDLTTGSILLEMGGHANSLAEAVYCGELVGKSLAKTLLSLKG